MPGEHNTWGILALTAVTESLPGVPPAPEQPQLSQSVLTGEVALRSSSSSQDAPAVFLSAGKGDSPNPVEVCPTQQQYSLNRLSLNFECFLLQERYKRIVLERRVKTSH